jgi:hypothetical protein
MAAAAIGSRLYCYGGVGAIAGRDSILDVSGDLWCFDTRALRWSEVLPSGPSPPPRRCPGWSAAGGVVHLWGGSGVGSDSRSVTFLSDSWMFEPATARWTCLEPGDGPAGSTTADGADRVAPGPRYCAAVAHAGDRLVVFGGYTEDAAGRRQLDDTWIAGAGAWRRVPGAGDGRNVAPPPRYGCMFAVSGADLYVCGGAGDGIDRIDLWRFDVPRRRWERLEVEGGVAPAPRYYAAMAVHDGRVVLFGGRSRWHPTRSYNDLWTFDLGARHWTEVEPHRTPHRYDRDAPYPGYHAKSAACRIADHLYLLCGEGRHGHVSDFWRLDLSSLRWEMIQPARPDDPILW